jgi:hypothetical protein
VHSAIRARERSGTPGETARLRDREDAGVSLEHPERRACAAAH